MTTKLDLAKLVKVELREAWDHEATDFTPWLAKPENITLLGEELDLDLEVKAQEKNVGPFRADILCKDTATGDWVLIENQLEKTDHTHLGQLLTYAAGLQAATIVWVAERFCDEHRAALDWLNEITGEKFSFFGLEIELWQIERPPVAPKFNIVSKPNGWTKGGATPQPPGSPTAQLQQEYWAALREVAVQRKSFLRTQKPLPQAWTDVALGRTNLYLSAAVNTTKKWVSVSLVINTEVAKAHFKLLEADRTAIEAEAGMPLEWRELPHRKQSHVVVTRAADPTDKKDWPAQHDWMLKTLETFHKVFSQRVKNLPDASEIQAANHEGV